MEIVGNMPKQSEISLLRLWNLTWPLNTTPRQGCINTFGSGDPP